MAETTTTLDWTCARCEMTVSWAANVEHPQLPDTWAEQDGLLYCLFCRREMAGDDGLAGAGDNVPTAERNKIRNRARLEFELKRDPSRADNQVAKSCRTSIFAVRKARSDLGIKTPA